MKKLRPIVTVVLALAAVAMIALGVLGLFGLHPFSPAVGAFAYICFGFVVLVDVLPTLRFMVRKRRGEILVSLEGRPEDVAAFKEKLKEQAGRYRPSDSA